MAAIALNQSFPGFDKKIPGSNPEYPGFRYKERKSTTVCIHVKGYAMKKQNDRPE